MPAEGFPLGRILLPDVQSAAVCVSHVLCQFVHSTDRQTLMTGGTDLTVVRAVGT
jgi:hypothetical protein